jgi:hypothetical protein
MRIISTLTLVALVATLSALVAPLSAQAAAPLSAKAAAPLSAKAAAPLAAKASAGRTTPITLAIVDSMPVQTAKALLVRKANGRTLLVLARQHATPETLGAGIVAARHFATQPADGNERVVAIQGGVPRTSLSAGRRAYLQRQLAAVQARRTGSLGALGQGRFMEFSDDRTVR